MSQAALYPARGRGEDGEARMLSAALAAFVEKGFHGASMREIGERAESSVSSAYYYFSSKQAILYRIVYDITAELADSLEAAERAAGSDPAERLAAVVRLHVLFHAERQDASFIGNSELRSLGLDERAAVMVCRDRVTAAFERPVIDGATAKLFDCPDPVLTTRAIVTMATAVAVWRRADGVLAPEAIADRYVELALRMVGARS